MNVEMTDYFTPEPRLFHMSVSIFAPINTCPRLTPKRVRERVRRAAHAALQPSLRVRAWDGAWEEVLVMRCSGKVCGKAKRNWEGGLRNVNTSKTPHSEGWDKQSALTAAWCKLLMPSKVTHRTGDLRCWGLLLFFKTPRSWFSDSEKDLKI